MRISLKKAVSFIATFAILFNSLVAPLSVLAQEVTPEPTPTPKTIIEATAIPTATPDATPTEITTPTPEATPEIVNLVTPVPTETPVATQTPESNSTDSTTLTTSPSAQPTTTPTFTPVPQVEDATISTTVVTTNIFPSTVQNDLFKLITDKIDYTPTEVAIISGSNFDGNKTYGLTVSSTDDPATSTTVDITTDGNGSFRYNYQLDDKYRPNYLVEVRDNLVIVANTTFKDSRWVIGATVNGGPTTTVLVGSNVDVITQVLTFNGLLDWNNDWRSTSYTVEGNSPVCVDTTNHNNTGVHTESFTITAPSAVGMYDVTFKAFSNDSCSAGGNILTSLSLTLVDAITTIDTVSPVIVMNGSTPISVELGSSYVDAGATATDNVDGDITGSIVTNNTVDTNVVGSYTVKYDVNDLSGNAAVQVVRTVEVRDTIAPSIPADGLPNDTILDTNNFDFTWDASSDLSPIIYEYQASRNPAQTVDGVLKTGLWHSGTLPSNMIHSSGASDGIWYWQVRAKDAYNNYSTWSPVWNVMLDTTNPTNPGTPIADKTTPTNQSLVTWTWTASSDATSGIQQYLWNLWHNSSNVLSGNTTSTSATINLSAYGDGQFVFDVAAEDNAGNQSSTTTSSSLELDTVAPAAPILNSPINNYFTQGIAFNQTWFPVSDATLYEYQSCYVDPGDVNGPCTSIKYSQTLTGTTKSVGAGQPDSHFWWRVRARDAANNWGSWSESRELTIDNTAPNVPTLTSPSNNSFVNTSGLVMRWNVVTDISSPVTYNYRSFWLGGSYGPVSTGTNNFINASGTPENVYTWQVRACDSVGNCSMWTPTWTVTVDNTAPTVVSIDSDGQTYNLATITPHTIKVTFSENIANIPYISVHSVPVGTQIVNNCSDSDAKTFCFNYSVLLDQEETHTIYISDAQDVARNTMALNSSHYFYVDTIAPTATINYSTTNWTNGNVVATLNPSEPITITNNSGSDTYTFSENGFFTFEFVDAAGNTGSETASVSNIDKVNPSGSWITPTNGLTISGIVPIEFNATDDLSGIKSIVYQYQRADGADTFHDIIGTDWNTTSLPLDNYTLRAVVTDNADNTANFDITVGVAAIISAEDGMGNGHTTAVISWTTDRPTKSRVVYDTMSHPTPDLTDPNLGYASSTDTYNADPKVLTHLVTLSGLSAGTRYYYRTISEGSPAAISSQHYINTLTYAGTPESSNNSGGSATVLGMSTTGSTSWSKLTYAKTSNIEDDVLGAETDATVSSSPTPSGIEISNENRLNILKWIITHKTISFGFLFILILIAYLTYKYTKKGNH